MTLTEMLVALRIELQDVAAAVYSDDDLERAITKTVSLMARFLPKKALVETTIVRDIDDESITITDGEGTTAYKPVKVGSMSIPNKTLDTDYTINYLTGEISGLTDADYTISYELDSRILDIETILDDCLRIERIEYPIKDGSPSFPTFDIIDKYLVLRTVSLIEEEHLRINYLSRWTAPTAAADGDFPSHLDANIIIGSVGQALLYLAEKYVQEAVGALAALTPPTDYSFVKPDAPTLPIPPTAPTAPSLSFTDVEYALERISRDVTGTETGRIPDAVVFLTAGEALINAATRGESVGANYGQYANITANVSSVYVSQALAFLKEVEDILAKYSAEVSSFGSDVNSYANEASATVSRYRGAIEAEGAGISNYTAQIQKYLAQTGEQEMKARNFLEIAGRYLASGQSKINEFLSSMGVKIEFQTQKAS